ncbi:MAG: 2,3-bisphosphoglycerate-independent phosphoglycerate mutase [Gemmatimonadetes bacterium]|nr:2,3-bisphosphoglycerate-independent phosphoglycerate mutase [Gemmatimonadota bacterium]MYG85490.1 2,3-bisphosphoglycerate-independent phosphoglycerate mutase [Gemmatimonadota bacterium]MYJ88231.1 2,3-bisphosphoglycerate-independent phosphoglycerate mutase [Gemmatimonadota bacterium]
MNAPVALVILDGWGIAPRGDANAVLLAETPNFDRLWQQYSHTMLSASGEDVGLPPGIMGNSEVGHLNLGAGRVVRQEVSRINESIDDGSFFENAALVEVLERLRGTGGRLHLLGLTSDGLVHSAEKHYLALLEMARRRGLTGDRVLVHAILDGRDTSPRSAPAYLETLQEAIERLGVSRIATVTGRYYAMDRDNRWERVRRAYELFTVGKGYRAGTVAEAVQAAYDRGETDEFVSPTVIGAAPDGPAKSAPGRPANVISDGDAVIVFNFRADRGRQLVRAFIETNFDGFDRGAVPDIRIATMTPYDARFDVPCAFRPPERMRKILGETISLAGRRQLRVAETEKYPHVTYFFNGGDERPFDGEDRILVPSPRDVATYDEKPEMSAPEVAARVADTLRGGEYDFVLVNFANPDMVGHTGSLPAAVAAVETVDRCLGVVMDAVRSAGGGAVVTADHGNAERMVDPATSEPHTAHTTNPVPLILVDDKREYGLLRTGGRLADVAPTVLSMMGISCPESMSGTDLAVPDIPADRAGSNNRANPAGSTERA